VYIVYDGRASYDIDAATVLEVLDTTDKNQAIREFKREWKDHDAVLADKYNNIIPIDTLRGG